MSTVLIIGAHGFLGKALTKRLSASDTVVAVVRKESDCSSIETLCSQRCTAHSLEKNTLVDLFSKYQITTVINCAVSYSNEFARSVETNLSLPLTLLDLCVQRNVAHYIGFDSFYSRALGAYAHLPAYQLCKKQIREWYQFVGATLPISQLQIEQMYGPGDNPQKSIMSLLVAMARNTPELELTDGTQKRDFIYVDDVAHAVQLLLKNSPTTPGVHTIEVGSGETHSLRSFLELAKTVSASRTKLCFGARPQRAGEIMSSVANTTFLNSIGWKAETSLESGLKFLFDSIA